MGAEIVQVLLKLLEIQYLDICMLVKLLDIAEYWNVCNCHIDVITETILWAIEHETYIRT